DKNQPNIFSDLSFSVKAGDALALLGRNGVGKSTLLSCLMCFNHVQQGHIYCSGVDLMTASIKERAKLIAFVPQIIGADIAYTVRDYISFGATLRTGMFSSPGKEEFEKTDSIMDMLGITALKDKPCRDLSGGQRQLVADQLRAQGYAIIFTTHLPEQALLLNSRVGLCRGGTIDFYNSVSDVTLEALEEIYKTKLSLFYSDTVNRTVCVIPQLGQKGM
ncbi:MAG: ABC transporter ATP-binding protein, partial [Veillonella sp.]|nr:ABC transporter ATP-binding protein [Veillonella sp.]